MTPTQIAILSLLAGGAIVSAPWFFAYRAMVSRLKIEVDALHQQLVVAEKDRGLRCEVLREIGDDVSHERLRRAWDRVWARREAE